MSNKSGLQALEQQLNMAALPREYIEIRHPYVKAICDILAVAMPVRMILNTETGELIKEYDDRTQLMIDDLKQHLDSASDNFLRKHGLGQS